MPARPAQRRPLLSSMRASQGTSQQACPACPPSHLALAPLGVPRPWGGRQIARRFGWDCSDDCGEWWLLSTYPGAATPVRDSEHDLSSWLSGTGRLYGWPDPDELPLLLKFLDAREPLSLQVHPDDAAARFLGLPNGKSEAWHILSAEPGAVIYLGLAPGVTVAELLDTISAGISSEQLLPLLAAHQPRAGDTFMVEAGTVHAIGGGLTLFEVQQRSDATWRLHDWERTPPRELHWQQAARSLKDNGHGGPIRITPSSRHWTRLVEGEHFQLSRSRPSGELPLTPEADFATVTVLAGEGTLFGASGEAALRPGDTIMVVEPVLIEGQGLDLLSCEPHRRADRVVTDLAGP